MNHFNNGDEIYTVGDIFKLERENKRLESLLESKTEIANQLKDNLTAAFERELQLKAQLSQLRNVGQALREPWDLNTILGASTRHLVLEWDRVYSATPVQCLSEIKAQAVEDAADSCCVTSSDHNVLITTDTRLRQYANQLANPFEKVNKAHDEAKAALCRWIEDVGN